MFMLDKIILPPILLFLKIKFFAFVLVGHPEFLTFMHLCFKAFLLEPTFLYSGISI